MAHRKKGEKKEHTHQKKTRFHIVPCVLLPLFLKKKNIYFCDCLLPIFFPDGHELPNCSWGG